MVKLNSDDNSQFNNNSQNNSSQNQLNKPSGLVGMIGQLLPLTPFAFEQFTGQKVPQMTGTIAEMRMALMNIQTNLQTLIQNQQTFLTNQQQFAQRLVNLEQNAQNQFTNLTTQVQNIQSLRLTHEKKQIEYNQPRHSEEETEY